MTNKPKATHYTCDLFCATQNVKNAGSGSVTTYIDESLIDLSYKTKYKQNVIWNYKRKPKPAVIVDDFVEMLVGFMHPIE